MASSQVEIVSPSQFGYVLRKLNHKDMSKDTNSNSKSQTTLKKNLKEFVKDQFQSCLPPTYENSSINATKQFQQNQNVEFHYWGKNNSSYKKGYDEETTFAMYKKQSKVIDEWAAQQAKDMINTKARQNEDIDFSSCLSKSRSISSRDSSLIREPSPTPSDNSSTDFSVSSLVQKWRGFEAESRNNQTNNNINISIQQENVKDATMPQEQFQQKGQLQPESISLSPPQEQFQQKEQLQHEQIQAESISLLPPQKQFQQKGQLQNEQIQPESISSSIDGKEEERMRVIDIVRRLASSNQGVNDEVHQECKSFLCSSLMSLKVGMDIKDQPGIFAAVVCSPKLRGRQAIADFIKRMERNRYQEVDSLKCRQPVSKFPHRGRIQSLLRYKFLRRGLCTQNDQQLHLLPRKYESKSSEKTSTINCLRKRYSTVKNEETNNVKNSPDDVTDINQHEEKTSMSTDTCKQDISEKEDSNIKRQDEKLDSTGSCQSENNYICTQENLNKKHETNYFFESNQEQSNDVIQSQVDEAREQEFCVDNVITSESVEIISTEKPVQMEFSSTNISEQHNSNDEEEDNRSLHNVKMSLTTHVGNEQEEEEEEIQVEEFDSDFKMLEPNLDWTIDIARPRSYWEDRRQTWYQEIFSTHPQDEEIRQLLERGSVSSVLASDFRERMDQMVMSSLQRVFYSTTIDEEDEESFKFIDEVDNNDQSTTKFMNHQTMDYENHQEDEQNNVCDHVYSLHTDKHERDEVNDDVNVDIDEDEEKDEPTTSIQKFHDISEGYDQTPSSSQFPWIHYHDHEASDDSDNMASTSVQKHSRYHSYYHDTRHESSLKNFSSIEMELLLDLRAHMHRLHNEMAELRKSITSCMDVHGKLQQSFTEGVPAACNLEEQRKRKKASVRNTKKGSCCICYKKPVDSLIYRCGHTCTCLDCAQELQWNSEKCPKCQARIIDVVRIRLDA
ncbi:hypothetical protein RND81_05G188500 [Saponaria officinalis]|uniref:RING-type domain-containing protein n=1 Tax=Saponaria officinalis TaxID=3572 RepID=A0AAW1KU29_SAPOF